MNGESSYRRFVQGDSAALGELIERYNKSLVFYLSGILGSVASAEDAAADAFVAVLVKKPRLRDDGAFGTYLYRAGRNRAYDMLRAKKRRGETSYEAVSGASEASAASAASAASSASSAASEAADALSLEQCVLKGERDRTLHAAMAELKEDYRDALHLLYFEDMSYAEAAKALGKSEKQLANLAYRAKAALKTALLRKGFEYCED